MTLVAISSDLYGVSFGVVRAVTDRELLIEMSFRPPAGTPLVVHFRHIYHHDAFGEVADHLSMQCQVSGWEKDRVWLCVVELVADPPDNLSSLRMQ